MMRPAVCTAALVAVAAASPDHVFLQAQRPAIRDHFFSGGRAQLGNGTAGPSSAALQAVLDRHNQYRCMHGAPLMTWDDAIAANAQQYATSTGGQMRHSSFQSRQNIGGFSSLGENLAWGVTDAGAVQMWYDEIEHTNGGLTSSFSMATGHYTQVVWRDSTKLGCGIQGRLLVCQYGAAGNMQGQFSSQVRAPTRSAQECSGSQGASGSPAPAPTPTPTPAPTTSGGSSSGGSWNSWWPWRGQTPAPTPTPTTSGGSTSGGASTSQGGWWSSGSSNGGSSWGWSWSR